MARIRTIKPKFFRSQDVSRLSYRARLTWIGLWTYVDDEGRGEDDPRIIKGDLWPLEDDVTWRDVEDDLTELSRSLHVIRYMVSGRHFLAIPKWFEHQVISRPTKSKFPEPPPVNIREAGGITEDSVSTHGANTAGTGNREQGTGNREQGKTSSSEVAIAPTRPDVLRIIELLDSEITANGSKPPSRNKKNLDAARLLLDRDGHPPNEVEWLIVWSQRDEFWRLNILSMSKFREKYDQLRLKASRETPKPIFTRNLDRGLALTQKYQEEENVEVRN